MKEPLDEILDHALQLPREARAALAGTLIDSLDEEPDERAEDAWAEEIERRLKKYRHGKAKIAPWSEVRRDLIGDLNEFPAR